MKNIDHTRRDQIRYASPKHNSIMHLLTILYTDFALAKLGAIDERLLIWEGRGCRGKAFYGHVPPETLDRVMDATTAALGFPGMYCVSNPQSDVGGSGAHRHKESRTTTASWHTRCAPRPSDTRHVTSLSWLIYLTRRDNESRITAPSTGAMHWTVASRLSAIFSSPANSAVRAIPWPSR